jgi:hypothetical protein
MTMVIDNTFPLGRHKIRLKRLVVLTHSDPFKRTLDGHCSVLESVGPPDGFGRPPTPGAPVGSGITFSYNLSDPQMYMIVRAELWAMKARFDHGIVDTLVIREEKRTQMGHLFQVLRFPDPIDQELLAARQSAKPANFGDALDSMRRNLASPGGRVIAQVHDEIIVERATTKTPLPSAKYSAGFPQPTVVVAPPVQRVGWVGGERVVVAPPGWTPDAPPVGEARKLCTCDMKTVLLRAGCRCGGV